ncbi:unnamed protein product [Fraxinus pennsylvanica]|uniref:Pentatricopeptide repeat-containing protein n=1 Tax=Fraxinus pennsylvanica TaxID=56036 RepID=A0AAD2E8M3_9LAMI|nr:unnamed protein product [Fraxinus pennsylvanica]
MIISRQIQTLFQRSKTAIEILHLHSLLLKTSLDHHEYFFSQLILSAASISLHDARKIFDYSPIYPPPLFAWNTIIKEYSNNSSTPIESIKLFVKLLRTVGGFKPDKFTYPFVIKACGRCSMLEVGGSVHSMALKAGFNLDPHVNNTLLRVYGACGVIDFARRVFDEMADRDVVSWSSMIAGYVDCEHPLGALMVFREMKMVNEKPNLVTLEKVTRNSTIFYPNRYILNGRSRVSDGRAAATGKIHAPRDLWHTVNAKNIRNSSYLADFVELHKQVHNSNHNHIEVVNTLEFEAS